MDAKEMFKELGFEESDKYTYTKHMDVFNISFTIVVEFLNSSYVCYATDENYRKPQLVNKDLHKAITKKLEELGWLE